MNNRRTARTPSIAAAPPLEAESTVHPTGAIPTRSGPTRTSFALILALALCGATQSFAQEGDSVAVVPLAAPAAAQAPSSGSGSLKSVVKFVARDSLVLSIDSTNGDIGRLYGDTRVEYEEAVLQAQGIDIFFKINELRAYGSESGSSTEAMPTFKQGSETFAGTRMAYNMSTERGRVVGARTDFEEGFIRANIAKVTEDSTLYIKDGIYTTCDCVDDPSYSLRSSKMKVVNRKWVYTGPIQLYIFNIPMPLWLPFGLLPAMEGRRSGPLPPQYGEDEFGFYLRDWGWYWALNDYTDLQLQLGAWSRGSLQAATLFRYNRRYHYNGSLNLNLARLRNGESGDPDFQINRTASLRWNHSQTLNPTSSLSANVDLTTSGYLRAVSELYDDRVAQTVSSAIAYRKSWPGSGRNVSVNLNQRQSFETGSVSLTIPNLNFTQNTRKPFLRDSRGPGEKERWFEKLSYRYTFNTSNVYSFTPLSDEKLIASGDTSATDISWYDAMFSADKYRRATGKDTPFKATASHDIPITATFTLNRLPLLGGIRLNLSPSFNYEEDWFIRTERRTVVDSTNLPAISSESGFFALRQFSSGVSANTTFYGIFPLRVGPYSGLRHTVRPTVGFSYQPDFYSDAWGYTRTWADTTGKEIPYAIVSGVRSGEQRALNYSVSNTFETKRVADDSTQTGPARTTKLLNLDISSRYNFAADSLRMGDISLSARTSILGKLDLNFRSTFSPYNVDDNGDRVDDYVFNLRGLDIARLTQFSVSARTSVRSSRRSGAQRPVENPRANPDPFSPVATPGRDPTLNQIVGSTAYSDFSIPWSLTADFTYGLTRRGTSSDRRAILNTSVDFNLTPNWKVSARTGYDFEQRDIVTTTVALYRDFECWQMSINWIPFGDFQSYGFDLHVKSGHLADLLRLRHPRDDVQGRFTRLSGL
jgi:lipopolysaccharide assembly outer membrane protein LptD (OstA)